MSTPESFSPSSDIRMLPEITPSPSPSLLPSTDAPFPSSLITIRVPTNAERDHFQQVQSSLLEVQYDNEFYDALFTNIVLKEQQQQQQQQQPTLPPSLPPSSVSSIVPAGGNDMIVVAAFNDKNCIVGVASARKARGQEEIHGNEEDNGTNIIANLWESTAFNNGILNTVTDIWYTVTSWLPFSSSSSSSSNAEFPIESETMSNQPTVGYIMTLGILPSYRRKGIAQLLLQFIYEQLQTLYHCQAITLHCVASNLAAQKLYLKEGFQIIQRLPQHYYFHRRYHDAIFMKKGFGTENNRSTESVIPVTMDNESSAATNSSAVNSSLSIEEISTVSTSLSPSVSSLPSSVTEWLSALLYQYVPWMPMNTSPPPSEQSEKPV